HSTPPTNKSPDDDTAKPPGTSTPGTTPPTHGQGPKTTASGSQSAEKAAQVSKKHIDSVHLNVDLKPTLPKKDPLLTRHYQKTPSTPN
ncbi:hypothetical protein, partial [Rathayibacter toxicus]